jgi:hypothetical protein
MGARELPGFPPRETREGWPLQTVETEVNGGSKRTNEKGPSWLVRACRASTRDFCSVLAARTKVVFPHHSLFHYFNSFVHSDCLLVSVSAPHTPLSLQLSADSRSNLLMTTSPFVLLFG